MDALTPALLSSERIQRRTRPQTRYLPAVEATVARLLAGEAMSDPFQWLRTALLRSPYYADVLPGQALAPADLRDGDDLAAFPILDRNTLGHRWHDVPPLPPSDEDRLVTVQSSGTSGTPLTVVKSGYDCIHMWAVLRYWAARLNLDLGRRPRVVLLDSLPSGLEYSVRLPLLHDGALHRISLHRPRARARLEKVGPAVIFTDPAGAAWLAHEVPAISPRLCLSSAQHLDRALRRSLQEHLGAPVIDYYATTETGPIAWSCPRSWIIHHILAPDVWVESLDGALHVTSLRPTAMPLLRYRTGDRGALQDTSCPCGFRGPSISALRGRGFCLFVSDTGRTFDAWQLAWIFKHHPIADFRLLQIDARRFDLDVVGDPSGIVPVLRQALAALGCSSALVEARRVPAIAWPGGKVEPFQRVATMTLS